MKILERFRSSLKARVAARVLEEKTIKVPVKAPYYHEIIEHGVGWLVRIYRREGGTLVREMRVQGTKDDAYAALIVELDGLGVSP